MKKKRTSLHNSKVTQKSGDVCLNNFYTMLEEEAMHDVSLSKRKCRAKSKQGVKINSGISPESLNNMLKMLIENDE